MIRLAGIAERFATALDYVDTGFLGDGVLDVLPAGVQLGATRVGGVDLNKPRMREAVRSPLAARTIAALLTLREQGIAPILANVHRPKMGRKPAHWIRVDRDYGRIRIDMQTLFTDLAIETPLAA